MHVAVICIATAQFGACILLRGNGSIKDPRGSKKWLEAKKRGSWADLDKFYAPSQDKVFMHYMAHGNVVVCGCGKCGTSSMYEYLYEKTFGHPWTYEWEPYIQDVESSRWALNGQQTWYHITDEDRQAELMQSAVSFALIRDPKERLISAWKSKLSCDQSFGVDYNSKGFVCGLQYLQGLPCNSSQTCMSLDEFASALLNIKQLGASWRLDRHFLPQNFGCFNKYRPESWTKIATINEPHSFSLLAHQLGTKDDQAPHEHSSSKAVIVSQRASQILDIVTKEEYDMIGDYLPTGTKPNISLAVGVTTG